MGERLTPSGRVFAAVVPSAEAVAEIAHRLADLEIPGRPVPPANWHVTLRFVGQVEEVAYERWLGALSEAELPAPFPLVVAGLGAFPRVSRATVLWLGVEGEGLKELATAVDEAAARAGLGREERPFRPHLTLARVRPPEDVRPLLDLNTTWRVRFDVDSFHVMAAVGSRYHQYESFAL